MRSLLSRPAPTLTIVTPSQGSILVYTESKIPLFETLTRYVALLPALTRPYRVSRRVAETVKVPQMAESISEGTLKSWLKQPGEYVNADEEVATIETDKVCSAKPSDPTPRSSSRSFTCSRGIFSVRPLAQAL